MPLVILAVTIFAIVSILAGAAGIFVGLKLFKIEGSSYSKSLIFCVASILALIVASVVFGFIVESFLTSIMKASASFLTLWYLLKKYYRINWIKSLVIYVISAIFQFITILPFIFITYSFVAQPFVVQGNAMSPAYNKGDYVLINKIDGQFNRGDVIVFQNPRNETEFYIKRIIGLPFDKVDIHNGQVIINDLPLTETYSTGTTLGDSSITLKSNEYFIMGDNRSASFDSRSFGPIAKSNIIGKIFYTFKN